MGRRYDAAIQVASGVLLEGKRFVDAVLDINVGETLVVGAVATIGFRALKQINKLRQLHKDYKYVKQSVRQSRRRNHTRNKEAEGITKTRASQAISL